MRLANSIHWLYRHCDRVFHDRLHNEFTNRETIDSVVGSLHTPFWVFERVGRYVFVMWHDQNLCIVRSRNTPAPSKELIIRCLRHV